MKYKWWVSHLLSRMINKHDQENMKYKWWVSHPLSCFAESSLLFYFIFLLFYFYYISFLLFSILWGFSPCICLAILCCIYFIIIHIAQACTIPFYFIYYNSHLMCSTLPWDHPRILPYFSLFYLPCFSFYFVVSRAYRDSRWFVIDARACRR